LSREIENPVHNFEKQKRVYIYLIEIDKLKPDERSEMIKGLNKLFPVNQGSSLYLTYDLDPKYLKLSIQNLISEGLNPFNADPFSDLFDEKLPFMLMFSRSQDFSYNHYILSTDKIISTDQYKYVTTLVFFLKNNKLTYRFEDEDNVNSHFYKKKKASQKKASQKKASQKKASQKKASQKKASQKKKKVSPKKASQKKKKVSPKKKKASQKKKKTSPNKKTSSKKHLN
jgi:hypothetical protein